MIFSTAVMPLIVLQTSTKKELSGLWSYSSVVETELILNVIY